MSVSEALRWPRNESEIEGAAPECAWSSFALCPADDDDDDADFAEESAGLPTGTNNSHKSRLRSCGLPEVGWRSYLVARFRSGGLVREEEVGKGTIARRALFLGAQVTSRGHFASIPRRLRAETRLILSALSS